MSRLKNLIWQARALWKRVASIFKRDWTIEDYPIRFRFCPPPKPVKSSGLKYSPWSAATVNWPGMMGAGNTKQEALAELRKIFENFKAGGRSLPRPGTHVPIEFAPSARVDMHPELRVDFIRSVLDLTWAFLSDESSLSDFHGDETNKMLVEKIRTVYGVDVSDIPNGNLADIFERIVKTRVA
jgi:predicted RNase H-like HicB family nuclease